MAVPKKRTGKSAQAKRRANWKATKPETTICKNCGEVVLTHTVCPACGTYKGKVVSIKAQQNVEPAVEEAKAEEVKEIKEVKKAKKSTKKAEEAPVEETKAETTEETAEEKPKKTRKSTKKAESEE